MVVYNNLLLFIGFFLLSCNDESKTSAAAAVPDTVNTTPPVVDTITPGCYSQLSGRDTSLLQVTTTSGVVSGTLSYNIYQKDRNDGSFQGELVGDTLRGWYLFKSEGVMSVREVTWQVKGDQLWQRIGEMTEKNDTMMFALPRNIKFDGTRPFRKVPCVL
jgi:hypothetical protein